MDQLQAVGPSQLSRKDDILDCFKIMEDLHRGRSGNDTCTQAGECIDLKHIHNPLRPSIVFITTCKYI